MHITMIVKNYKFKANSLSIFGLMDGNNHHTYNVRLDTNIIVYKKVAPEEKNYYDGLQKTSCFLYCILVGVEYWQVIKLKDITYEIIFQKDMDFENDKKFQKNFDDIITFCSTNAIKQVLIISNSVFLKKIASLQWPDIKTHYYTSKMDDFQFIKNKKFYKSKVISNILELKNWILFQKYETYLKDNFHKIEENVERYISEDNVKYLFTDLKNYFQILPSLKNKTFRTIIINQNILNSVGIYKNIFVIPYYKAYD